MAVSIPPNPFPSWFQGLIAAPPQAWAMFVWYGLKKGTRDGYKSAQQQYEHYVYDYFPSSNPWPATETLICAFAAHRLEGLGPYTRLKGTSLEGYISGLRSYHVDHMLPVDVFTSETRSEEHTSELQSLTNLVCRLLLEKKKKRQIATDHRH